MGEFAQPALLNFIVSFYYPCTLKCDLVFLRIISTTETEVVHLLMVHEVKKNPPEEGLVTLESIQDHEVVNETTVANEQSNSCTNNATSSTSGLSPVDPVWQEIDPTPDVRALFATFNDQYFGGKLSSVEVRWSPRMTLCAGICVYEGNGGLCSVRLSEALLKFRPRSDLVETLLHEMIHAYLFITQKNRDREDHGPTFKFHMERINQVAKTNITVFHSFHDEVDSYRVHWWHCNGPCSKQPPFFGLVRRSMNRPPGPSDRWWAEHQVKCNGEFMKIKEPSNYGQKSNKNKAPKLEKKESDKDIRTFFPKDGENIKPEPSPSTSQEPKPSASSQPTSSFVPFSGVGRVLGTGIRSPASCLVPPTNVNTEPIQDGNLVTCPVCNNKFSFAIINLHLDSCVS